MITVLFDIDGTLIRTGGAGMIAIGKVMSEMFGIESIPKVAVHGRTDTGILGDVFTAANLKYDEHRDTFTNRYVQLLEEKLHQSPGLVLPGVHQLLDELNKIEQVALGILTGNGEQAANVKLRHFELDKYFSFGGYGDFHSDRNDVAAMAKKAAQDHLGSKYEQEHIWVIGDTVNDITCARHIGAKVVAVETGGANRETLNSANPDLTLADLTSSEFIDRIRQDLTD